MCAMDAMWRTYGFQTYPASIPAVYIVKITLENRAQKFLNKDQYKDIIVYLNRPSQLRTMKIDEMFNQYSWSYTLLKHYERHPALLNVEYWEIKIPSL